MAYTPPLNGGRINASFAGNTAGASMVVSTGTIVFAGGNNVTLSQTTGANGATVSFNAAAGGGAQSMSMYGLGNTTQNSSTNLDLRSVSLNGLGGLSVGYSNGSVQLSGPVVSSVSATGALSISSNGATVSMGVPAFSAGMSSSTYGGATGGTSGTASNQVVLAAGSNITLSQSTGAGGNTLAIYGPNALTSQSNQAISASNGSFAFQTAGFSNANGVTFGTSAGSILTASVNTSYAASNHSHGNPTLNLTNLSGATASASNGLTLSLSAAAPGGGAVISNSQTGYSTGTINLVEGSGAITINSTTGQQFKFNVPGTSSLVGTNGISVSTAGNTISIDGNGLSTLGGGGATLSYYNPQDGYLQVTGQQGQATLHVQPTPAPNVSFDRFAFPLVFTGATSVTASVTISLWAGIYTRNASSLSLLTSYSTSNAITHSGTANSSQNVGLKLLTMGASSSLSEGAYYVGILSRTTTGGGAATISQILASQQNSNFAGLWGQAASATQQYTRGLGAYTATTTAIPASIAFSQLNGTASNVLRQPMFYLVNGTF